MFAPGLLDAGPLIVMARLAVPVTVTVVKAKPSGGVLAESVNVVPLAVPAGTFATSLKVTILSAGTVPPVQNIVPPAPTDGRVHVKPGASSETKVIVPG